MSMRLNKEGMVAQVNMRKAAYEKAKPIHATFELTPRCGFNCRMCYVHLPKERIPQVGRGRELTADEWLRIGKQAAENEILSLCITGGDPLLHPEFPTIWTGLSQMGFRMTLQTNAAFLTADVLELLAEYPPDTVKITLYGASDETYRQVCRVDQGFTKTQAGIEALQILEIPVQLVTTFVKQNRNDEAAIIRFAKQHHLPWYYSTACYPSLRGAESEAEACALSVWDLDCAEHTARLWKSTPDEEEERLPAALCSGYRTEYNISWDGYMRFCLFLNEPNISVLDKSLTECWQELLAYQQTLRWPQECNACDIKKTCKRCLAHLACLHGGLGKVSPDYCRSVREMLSGTKSEKKTKEEANGR